MPNSIRLSDRQYCQLQAIKAHPRGTVWVDELAGWNQLTLGANKRRGFVVETPRRNGVMLTVEGRAALEQFENASFLRKVASTKFSSFLSIESAGRAKERKKGRVEITNTRRRSASST